MYTLMYASYTTLNVPPISPCRNPTDPLSKLNEDKERNREPKCEHGNSNQCIPYPSRSPPRCNPIIKPKRYGISNENDGDEPLAAEILIRIENVVDRAAAGGQAESDHPETDDETAPGNAVSSTDTP